MHWTSWYPCSNDTCVLPGVASPLKVLILGVPKCNPDVRVLIRCPTSTLHWADVGGWGGGLWGTHPPSGHVGAVGGIGCPGGIPPSPLGKVTSWSPSSGLCLLLGFPKVLVEGFWGAFSMQSATSQGRSSKSWCNLWSARLPSSAWRWCGLPTPGWGLPVGEWGSPSPSEGGDWVLGVCLPPLLYKPWCGLWKGSSPNDNGFFA